MTTPTEPQVGLYMHFKGGLYWVIGVASVESEPEQRVVVYQAIKDGTMWTRPVEVFTETVRSNGYQGNRFSYVPNDDGRYDEFVPSPQIPETATATTYTLTAGDLGTEVALPFEIKVEWRGINRWAISRHGRYLSERGKWDFEAGLEALEDQWINAHRFDLSTALRLADAALADIRVGGRTIEEAQAIDDGY